MSRTCAARDLRVPDTPLARRRRARFRAACFHFHRGVNLAHHAAAGVFFSFTFRFSGRPRPVANGAITSARRSC